jgi:hypothetical protein
MKFKNHIIKNHLMIANIITLIVTTLIMTSTNVSNYYAAHYVQFSLAYGILACIIHVIILTVRHRLRQKDTV